jgi:hypothetical protein
MAVNHQGGNCTGHASCRRFFVLCALGDGFEEDRGLDRTDGIGDSP